jgi:hypothetical protein
LTGFRNQNAAHVVVVVVVVVVDKKELVDK